MKSAECSLTARSFQLDETLIKCTPKIHSEADGHLKSYFAVNKIIFDYIQVERDVQLDSTVVQVLIRLFRCKIVVWLDTIKLVCESRPSRQCYQPAAILSDS